MRMIILLSIVFILLVGCASLGETVKGIAQDPQNYVSEATTSANNVKETIPELPYTICIGIGYAAAFFRRLYKNYKIDKAKKAVI